MKQIKIKKCKYLGCNKEVHSKNALFCLQHSRDLKEKRNAIAGLAVLSLSGIVGHLIKEHGNNK